MGQNRLAAALDLDRRQRLDTPMPPGRGAPALVVVDTIGSRLILPCRRRRDGRLGARETALLDGALERLNALAAMPAAPAVAWITDDGLVPAKVEAAWLRRREFDYITVRLL